MCTSLGTFLFTRIMIPEAIYALENRPLEPGQLTLEALVKGSAQSLSQAGAAW
jgi:hypothetical protein